LTYTASAGGTLDAATITSGYITSARAGVKDISFDNIKATFDAANTLNP
jgi:hypothetical protein